jgi:hypothetical protein
MNAGPWTAARAGRIPGRPRPRANRRIDPEASFLTGSP